MVIRNSMCRGGGGGGQKLTFLKEVVKLNWKFQGCGRDQAEKPSRGEWGMDFSKNSTLNAYHRDKSHLVHSNCLHLTFFFLMFISSIQLVPYFLPK